MQNITILNFSEVTKTASLKKNICTKRHLSWKQHLLVHPGIVSLLSRKAKHATDDPAVHLSPLIITDLLPLSSIFHLHVSFCHWDALPIWCQDGADTDILHLNVQTLRCKTRQLSLLQADLRWTKILVLAEKNYNRTMNCMPEHTVLNTSRFWK